MRMTSQINKNGRPTSSRRLHGVITTPSYTCRGLVPPPPSRVDSKVNKGVTKSTSLYRGNDTVWIQRSINKVYKPHGLPKEIAKMPTLIKYTDGMRLRKICEVVQANQWAYICEQKLQFREDVWGKLRIERIRPMKLRENFIRTFATYLPFNSHLPINNNKTVPGTSRTLV